jgi:transposase
MPSHIHRLLTLDQRQSIGNIAATNGKPDLQGINVSHVAGTFGCSRPTARKWLMEGLKPNPNYSDAPRSGRPPKLGQVQKNSMRRHAVHRDTSNKIKERLEHGHGIFVSRSSVARVLRSGRNPLVWRQIKHGKVLSRDNIAKRFQFCKEHISDDFKTYVFLDQFDDYPCFEADGSATHCWQAANSHPAPALGRPWSFRMYAAVGWGFKSPLIFTAPSPAEGTRQHKSKETFTAEGFIHVLQQLEPHLSAHFPDGDYVIIMDHAPQHTAKASKEATMEMGLPVLSDYTTQSWDQNIIENVWGVLRGHLRGVKAKSTDCWFAAYREAWERVKQGTINKLVEGMPARLERIIEAKGLWVPHH